MSKQILVVAAHPDDEVLGCGGTMARHASNGDKVHVLFMSAGVGSRENVKNDEINERRICAKQASKILGSQSPQFLNFPDNRMDSIALLDVVKSIELVIQEIGPDVVYTHHIGDLNIDHQITHKAVLTACRPQPESSVKEIYSFEVLSSTEWQTPGYHPFIPNVFVNIKEHMVSKSEALQIYGEEMQKSPHSRTIKNSIRLNTIRGNSVGMDFSEAFSLVRKVYF